MLDLARRRVNGRHDKRHPSLRDSFGDYLSAVVSELYVGGLGCALSASVAAALIIIPVGTDSFLDFFPVVARRSYETCGALLSILISIAPSNASIKSAISFWCAGSPSSLISIRAAMICLRLESAGSDAFFMPVEKL